VNEGRVLSGAEKAEWLRATGARRSGPHRFTGRILHWAYCSRCGLVLLKNDVSRKAAAKFCAWED
jgi:hypothetical protein